MKRTTRLMIAISLAILSGPAAAGLVPVPLSSPSSLSLMGLGIVVAVLVARYFKR